MNAKSFGYEVSSVLDAMRRGEEEDNGYVSQDAIQAGIRLARLMQGAPEELRESVGQLVRSEMTLRHPHVSVWWFSVLLEIKKDADLFLELISYVRRNAGGFSLNTQYYLFYQLKALKFGFYELDRPDVCAKLWGYFSDVVERYADSARVSLSEIPKEKRNPKRAFVITEQFLRTEHGPTKTALDRCKVLMTKLGKDVTLINTAEVLSDVGAIPFCGMRAGNYIQEEKNERAQEWKGVSIPYMQCEKNMPNQNALDALLSLIREEAPGCVVTIGGNSILANLVNRMLPVLAVGLCPSALELTMVKYQLLGRKLNDGDRMMLGHMGIPERSVIESVFTSSLKPQEEHISRAQLKVPETDFLLIVIGSRLDQEVTEEFLAMLDGAVGDGMHLGFLGAFGRFDEALGKFPKLKAHSSNLGFTKDILSRLEVCDLYVNPKRAGGGTSSVEAMHKGVPVVTLNYGDVAVNAGEGFCVETYADMQQKIREYRDNPEYYQEMSKKAADRSRRLLDSDGEFVRIMEEMERREDGQ